MTTPTKRSRSSLEPTRRLIDPRIRARRIAVVREQGRQRLRILVVVVGVVVLALLAWLVVHSPLFDVDRVDVLGASKVTPEQVRDASGLRRGQPLLLVELGGAARRVESLPWVEHASVQRKLPGRVRIRVTERTPAVWVRRAADRVTLVDPTGRVLGDAPKPPDGVPELRGEVRVPRPGRRVQPSAVPGLLEQLPEALRRRVVAVTMQGGEATLGLVFAPDVRLGRVEDVAAKGAAAQAVLAALGPGPVHFIDVRVPGAPATG